MVRYIIEMKYLVTFHTWATQNDTEVIEVYEKIKSETVTMEDSSGSTYSRFCLEEGTEAYNYAVKSLSSRAPSKLTLYENAVFTKKELENVRYYQLLPKWPLELEGKDTEDFGTQHVNGCPGCGLGKKLEGNIYIDRKFLHDKHFCWLPPEYGVSERMKKFFESINASGISFGDKILDWKNRPIDEFYELKVNNILPPMSPNTWFEKIPRIRFEKLLCEHPEIYERSNYKYKKEDLDNALDFNLTNESLNTSNSREMIVSSRIKDELAKIKYRARFTPVIEE